MTLMNWISIGITAALVVAYIVLKIYAKRKTDQYDGLGGIITRRKATVKPAGPEQKTTGIDSEKHKTP